VSSVAAGISEWAVVLGPIQGMVMGSGLLRETGLGAAPNPVFDVTVDATVCDTGSVDVPVLSLDSVLVRDTDWLASLDPLVIPDATICATGSFAVSDLTLGVLAGDTVVDLCPSGLPVGNDNLVRFGPSINNPAS
jgi:hypothetical protein